MAHDAESLLADQKEEHSLPSIERLNDKYVKENKGQHYKEKKRAC